MTSTQTIITTVSAAFEIALEVQRRVRPVAIGQKLSRTLREPAVSVVIETKASGTTVTHA